MPNKFPFLVILVSQWRVFLVTNDCNNLDEAMLNFCHLISLSALSREQISRSLSWKTEWKHSVLKTVKVSCFFGLFKDAKTTLLLNPTFRRFDKIFSLAHLFHPSFITTMTHHPTFRLYLSTLPSSILRFFPSFIVIRPHVSLKMFF